MKVIVYPNAHRGFWQAGALSPGADRLVVIAADAAAMTVDWRIVADPTGVRAEQPEPQTCRPVYN